MEPVVAFVTVDVLQIRIKWLFTHAQFFPLSIARGQLLLYRVIMSSSEKGRIDVNLLNFIILFNQINFSLTDYRVSKNHITVFFAGENFILADKSLEILRRNTQLADI